LSTRRSTSTASRGRVESGEGALADLAVLARCAPEGWP
jgi:hypothetical protein